MNKTLKQLLHEKKYQKVNVKIGSKSGSSFFYCGKAQTIWSFPDIKREREKLLRQSHKLKNALLKRLNNLDKIYEETYYKAKKRGIKNEPLYLKKLTKQKENERKKLPQKIESVQYDIDTPLLDRPVLEIVKGISVDESPCYIVYIKGNERGNYWTIQEYMKRR